MTPHGDDPLLVRRSLAGDADAFARLMARYENQVFSFLARLVRDRSDAEDAAQEVWIKAYRALGSFDPSRPFIAWILRIAHNSAVDRLRAKDPRAVSIDDEDDPVDLPEAGPTVEQAAESKDEAALIEKLLAALPPLYREALLLRHQEGLDLSAIARVLELPLGTVKVRLFRAREMMRRKLEAYGYAE